MLLTPISRASLTPLYSITCTLSSQKKLARCNNNSSIWMIMRIWSRCTREWIVLRTKKISTYRLTPRATKLLMRYGPETVPSKRARRARSVQNRLVMRLRRLVELVVISQLVTWRISMMYMLSTNRLRIVKRAPLTFEVLWRAKVANARAARTSTNLSPTGSTCSRRLKWCF